MQTLIEELQTLLDEFQALESANNGTINQFYTNVGATVERLSPGAEYVDGVEGSNIEFRLTTGETIHIGTEVTVTQAANQ